ncbi:MAG: M48 family metalloprotease [Sedimentisphaerales bacterium]|nr:M48 family metalloprotease [Sedimentisphaerales bacterium]
MTRGTILATACLGLALTVLSGCAVNPVTGEQEMMFFGPEKDVELGRKYAPYIENELGGRIRDENLQNYINQIGQRIARVCHRPDLAYYFAAVEEEGANAFAVPGGYVYITRGLLKELKSESQLAAILGHEVGHVVARDTMVAMSRQIGATALLAAAAVGDAPSDVVHATAFITGVLTLQYSREDEKDADLTGLSYMAQAGYDPNGMVQTMEILGELQTYRPVEFFSTHPNPESRIEYLKERIERRYATMTGLKQGQEEYAEKVLAPLSRRKTRVNTQINESWEIE